MQATAVSRADQVRQYVVDYFLVPTRAAGKRRMTVRAGDVHKGLGWNNLMPSVCSALDSHKFLTLSGVKLIDRRGPEKSTTAEWTFELPEEGVTNGTQTAAKDVSVRRVIATWDGRSFQPAIRPDGIEVGEQVVLNISQVSSLQELAGDLAPFVGTLSAEEAAEMRATMAEAFERIGNDW